MPPGKVWLSESEAGPAMREVAQLRIALRPKALRTPDASQSIWIAVRLRGNLRPDIRAHDQPCASDRNKKIEQERMKREEPNE